MKESREREGKKGGKKEGTKEEKGGKKDGTKERQEGEKEESYKSYHTERMLVFSTSKEEKKRSQKGCIPHTHPHRRATQRAWTLGPFHIQRGRQEGPGRNSYPIPHTHPHIINPHNPCSLLS